MTLSILQTILITAATLGLLVTIHEFGHFWVARRCGVKVLRFAVGFGKPLLRWRDRHDTEFVIAAIPLGGYVKMLDEREGEVPPELLPYCFNRLPASRRIAVVAAGPIANFLLAIAVYWVLFMAGVSGIAPVIGSVSPDSLAARAGLQAGDEIVTVDGEKTPTWQLLHQELIQRIGESGELRMTAKAADTDTTREVSLTLNRWLAGDADPDMVGGLGIELWRPAIDPVIEDVVPDSPAAKAGLQQGDRILGVDGQTMTGWEQWVTYIRARPEQSVSVDFERDGIRKQVQVVPARKVDDAGKAFGQVGVGPKPPTFPPEMIREFHYGPVAAMGAAIHRTWTMSVFSLQSLQKMVVGLISPKNLSGPITIAKVATASAKSGWEPYLGLLALLSISLGVLNLLPIPVLDGGHILFALPELFTGRQVSEKIQAIGYQIGLVIVVGIMALALYNDLMRL
ncbi:MAG: RIP metalloprotease RseP [Spongiibacteraceae bacterium]